MSDGQKMLVFSIIKGVVPGNIADTLSRCMFWQGVRVQKILNISFIAISLYKKRVILAKL